VIPEADTWLRELNEGRVVGWAPDLLYAELAHTLREHVRSGVLGGEDARQLLGYYVRLPLRNEALRRLAGSAFNTSLGHGISVYDCCYLALARALDATLVTADRRLAEHHDRVALLA
jgi:predicted nucleic acid-binding protein